MKHWYLQTLSAELKNHVCRPEWKRLRPMFNSSRAPDWYISGGVCLNDDTTTPRFIKRGKSEGGRAEPSAFLWRRRLRFGGFYTSRQPLLSTAPSLKECCFFGALPGIPARGCGPVQMPESERGVSPRSDDGATNKVPADAPPLRLC